MFFDENKKVLFVVGMNQQFEPLVQATGINPENMLIVQTYGPEISHAFSDVMRDIILAVYQENVKEIFVVGTKDDEKNTVLEQAVRTKIFERAEMKEKVQTLDYLFKNCMPEFTSGDISKWLEGSETLTQSIQKSVEIVRDHPLMPSDLTVHGLLLEKESSQLSEIPV